MTDMKTPEPASQVTPLVVRPRKGFPTGPLLAVGISAALAAWMTILPSAPDASDPKADEATAAPDLQIVRTIQSEAETVVHRLMAAGETRPLRAGQVTPRISGVVSTILVEKGQPVEEGQEILRLDVPGFSAQEREARAKLDEAQREMDKVESLSRKGLATEDQKAKARTSLATAEAEWASIEEARGDMILRAPFSGVLNQVTAEIGDNLSPGVAAAEVLDMSKLIVGVSIPQTDVPFVEVGQPARVSLATSQSVAGKVSFVSAMADSATRSFPMEVEVPNDERTLRAGMSADVILDALSYQAHSIPTAYLSLETSGKLSVKLVKDDVVESHDVSIVGSGSDYVQVIGLPEVAEIITVGQGFVQAGDAVRTEVAE